MIYDKEKTLAAFGNDQEIFDTVVKDFLEQLPVEITKLKDSLNAGDATSSRIAAHTLKGHAKTFYSAKAEEIAFKIEELAGEEKIEEAQKHFEDFEKIFNELSDDLKMSESK